MKASQSIHQFPPDVMLLQKSSGGLNWCPSNPPSIHYRENLDFTPAGIRVAFSYRRTQIYIYIYTRFQKHCTLKNIYTYIHLLSSQRENKRINMKTKGIYICIYIFQVAVFLKTGVHIYIYYSTNCRYAQIWSGSPQYLLIAQL